MVPFPAGTRTTATWAASPWRPGPTGTTTGFWKAGLFYVNRDDPALVAGARFGAGWTLNFGNPVAWLLITGSVARWAGLVALGAAAGM
jgi:hypothetical protein